MQRFAPSLGLALSLTAPSCGGDVVMEGGGAPLNVCACWAARQNDAADQDFGPCVSCWITTITADGKGGNGTCHYDQQRCLADPDCLAITGCAQACRDAACVDACLAGAGTEVAHDLFMDWSRCFCTECFDACSSYSRDSACTGAD